jgi:hypothetical protein
VNVDTTGKTKCSCCNGWREERLFRGHGGRVYKTCRQCRRKSSLMNAKTRRLPKAAVSVLTAARVMEQAILKEYGVAFVRRCNKTAAAAQGVAR